MGAGGGTERGLSLRSEATPDLGLGDAGRIVRGAAVARRCCGPARHPRRTAPRSDRGVGDVAHRGSRAVRRLDARAAAVIRIDAMWLAVEPVDMRAGADRLMARIVEVF